MRGLPAWVFSFSLLSPLPGLAEPAPVAAMAAPDSGRNLELGGLVTLDHHAELEGGDPVLDLGEVALGANVTLAGNILASVVIKSEHDLSEIFFDQAMAQVAPGSGAWTFLFGQQTVSHGLLSTRLISDPEILPYLELNQPAAAAAYAFGEGACGAASAGASATLVETVRDAGTSRDYAFLPYLDWTRGGTQARLSALFSRFRSDAGAAATAVLGPVLLDAEGFLRLPLWDNGDVTAGFLLGVEAALGGRFAVAYRLDGITGPDRERLATLRHGVGASVALLQDLFAAAELSDGRGGAAPGPRIALQVGLKSTLNLPGFQRATLTQEGKADP